MAVRWLFWLNISLRFSVLNGVKVCHYWGENEGNLEPDGG